MATRKVNWQLIKQAATVGQSRRHFGTSVVKTRGAVSGGGRKPWRQKGTGRARTGSIRGAQWRGGGIIFGPTKESRDLKLPQKMKKAALKELLNVAQSEGRLKIVDRLELAKPKTKLAKQLLVDRELPTSNLLMILTNPSAELILATANLAKIAVKPAGSLTIYDLIKWPTVVFDLEAAKIYGLGTSGDSDQNKADSTDGEPVVLPKEQPSVRVKEGNDVN